ncbi:MAG: gliding motility-associated C-terminal domain-containing protein [Bacteroidales bacterium]
MRTVAKISATLFCSILLTGVLYAQGNRYNENWMFGNYAGITFSGLNTGAVLGSSMASPEGVATVSDMGTGQLYFYSNGEKVWGHDHQIIQNGDGLMGNANSTQSVIFVPWPKSSNYFYAFTTDAEAGPSGLRYSILDRNMGINGTVQGNNKNIPLASPVTEKLALVKHCDMQSFWVVAHEWGSEKFYSWRITDIELEPDPVETYTGPVYDGAIENAMGYMKSSPNDDILVLAVTGSNRVDVYSFDNSTGSPEFAYSIDNIFQPYGIEFSQDQEMLYVSCLNGPIYQYNLQAAYVPSTQTLVGNANRLTGALQMGADGRIYITRDLDLYLGYIQYPASPGINCNYVQNGLYLNGRLSEAGLPPYIPILEHHHLSHHAICLGDTVYYDPLWLHRADSFVLYFGDRLGGSYDSTTQVPASYVFQESGVHKVEVVYFMCGSEFILNAMVCVQSAPGIYLGEDTSICSNLTYTLQGILNQVYCPTLQNFFSWNTGHTSQIINIAPPGQFSVTVTNLCGSGADTINIGALPSPAVSLGPDMELCAGEFAALVPVPALDSLVWNDGSDEKMRFVSEAGYYQVTITNEFNCSASDDILVSFIDPPLINWVLTDTVICIGHAMELNAGQGFDNYLWQDGSSGAVFLITDSGWYHVSVMNKCGIDTDSLHVTLEDCSLKLFVPNAFTPDGDGLNDEFRAFGAFVDDFSLVVYNRWGDMVFKSSELESGWDGKYLEKPAPAGTYAWKIIYLDATGEYHYLKGTMILIR